MHSRLVVFRRVKAEEKGDRRIEFEERSGADGHERLSSEFERNTISISRRGLMQRGYTRYFRIRHKRRVKLGCLLRFFVEPEMRGDGWHTVVPFFAISIRFPLRFHGIIACPLTNVFAVADHIDSSERLHIEEPQRGVRLASTGGDAFASN